MAKILVVDDEIGIRELLSEILYDEGHTVELAENASEARAARLRYRPDLVLLDIWMPDTDGVSLLKEWGAQGLLDMPVVMMSGHATIDTAVEATRIGAVDFLEKPITMQKLLKTVQSCLSRPVIRKEAPAAPAATTTEAPQADSGSPATPSTAAAPAVAAVAIAPDDHISSGMLGRISLDLPLREARDEFERAYFEYHLVQENGSMTRISESTGLERTHLYRKLRQLGIDTSRKRNSGN
ncbi:MULTISPECIES: response regulator [Oligella]|uniref:Transcriptional regulatory protein YycF n=1 Tax=Oligella urethralis TaxID=90245 RepID=A0A2X1UQA5_9BURK|nr:MULTISPECIES: response regulator [Oligella]AVL70235.1 two-component system response regulator [Oligella urethralis]MDK6202957.1 response regulator [Oligella urethralis]OFS88554.1 XRE family transcriptional regulator [Oligella sp. HMSC05A10]OFV51225.1 XRE family transcriptional regulator [Oligella sp. HMSC09E12]SPY09287.1 Transcriptional regulatory protein YycF [Oligella urethralis]